MIRDVFDDNVDTERNPILIYPQKKEEYLCTMTKVAGTFSVCSVCTASTSATGAIICAIIGGSTPVYVAALCLGGFSFFLCGLGGIGAGLASRAKYLDIRDHYL